MDCVQFSLSITDLILIIRNFPPYLPFELVHYSCINKSGGWFVVIRDGKRICLRLYAGETPDEYYGFYTNPLSNDRIDFILRILPGILFRIFSF